MDHDLTPSTPAGAHHAPDDSGPTGPGGAPIPTIRLSSPGSVVASIPLMFGFHPDNSLVVLGLSRTGGRESIRTGVRIGMDQVRGNERLVAADLTVRLRDQGAEEALLVAFGPRGATGTRARPDHCRKVMAAVKAQLAAGPREDQLIVVDAIFTSGNRWWSYMCRNSRCCPAGGTMVPSEPPAALAAMLAGQGPVYPSREAMDATFAPNGVTAARRMKTALRRALDEAFPEGVPTRGLSAARKASSTPLSPGQPPRPRSGRGGKAAGRKAPTQLLTVAAVAEATRLADELLSRCAADGTVAVSDAEAAALLVAMAEWRVRDYLACIAFEESRAERLLTLMSELSRRAPEASWQTTPLALAAWAAWALGRNSLAQCAVDRALATDRDYNFALLIRAGLHHGIPSASVRASADTTRRELFGPEELAIRGFGAGAPSSAEPSAPGRVGDRTAPGAGSGTRLDSGRASGAGERSAASRRPLPAQRAQADSKEARP